MVVVVVVLVVVGVVYVLLVDVLVAVEEAVDGKIAAAVETGEFGASMEVSLTNMGPVTFIFDF